MKKRKKYVREQILWDILLSETPVMTWRGSENHAEGLRTFVSHFPRRTNKTPPHSEIKILRRFPEKKKKSSLRCFGKTFFPLRLV